jgi:hypothetical protein
MMTGQEARDKVQGMMKAKGHGWADSVRRGWHMVCDALEVHHKARRPVPKVFEVHHMNEVARAAYLIAIASGHAVADAVAASKKKVGLA